MQGSGSHEKLAGARVPVALHVMLEALAVYPELHAMEHDVDCQRTVLLHCVAAATVGRVHWKSQDGGEAGGVHVFDDVHRYVPAE